MRLVTFVEAGAERLGFLVGDAVVDPLLASGDRALFANAPAFIGSSGKGITQPGLVAATRYCLPGDLIECEIESIGTLRNRVVAAQPAADYDTDKKLHRVAG